MTNIDMKKRVSEEASDSVGRRVAVFVVQNVVVAAALGVYASVSLVLLPLTVGAGVFSIVASGLRKARR